MKNAYEFKTYDADDYSTNCTVVAETKEKAMELFKKRMQKQSYSINENAITQLKDIIRYNYRGTEKITGIVLSGQVETDQGIKEAKKHAKYAAKQFKMDNPKLYKRGERANLDLKWIINSEIAYTVAEQVERLKTRTNQQVMV
tara:strand:- start:12 stop:440 length:429 start_codon:yes stop_codon:yes gene_type:complete